jgi:hypothetical protein
MSYRVLIQGTSSVPRQEIEGLIGNLPDVRRGEDAFLYIDAEEDVTVEIRLAGDKSQVIAIEVDVPAAVSDRASERMAALCAGLASRFGWQLKDPVGGESLNEAAMRRRFTGAPPLPVKAGGCLSVLAGMAALAVLFINAPLTPHGQ